MTLFKKLRELSETASPADWHIGHMSEVDETVEIDDAFCNRITTAIHRRDQAFICEMRNELGKMLEALDTAERTLTKIRNGYRPEDFALSGNVPYVPPSQLREWAADGLEQLRGLGGEG